MNLKDSVPDHQLSELRAMRSVSSQSLRSTGCALLMSDAHQSVLHIPMLGSGRAYCVYGFHLPSGQPSALLAFNGEYAETQTGDYLLGNGNRPYNPILMRFPSADTFSPFGQGGLNSYAYCLGDPVNNYDPTGNGPLSWFRKSPAKSYEAGAYSVLKNRNEQGLPVEMIMLEDAVRGQAGRASINWYGGALKWQAAEVKIVKGKADLVETDLGRYSNWVLNTEGDFVVGTYAVEGPKLTHAAMVSYASREYSIGSKIVASGEIKVTGGTVFFDNQSGHYKPPRNRMKMVRKHLEGMGIQATFMRIREE